LHHRDAMRSPSAPLEADVALAPLIQNINARLSQLVVGNPRLQLRVTSTDSDSLLRALVPHYQHDDGGSLPAGEGSRRRPLAGAPATTDGSSPR